MYFTTYLTTRILFDLSFPLYIYIFMREQGLNEFSFECIKMVFIKQFFLFFSFELVVE